MSSEERHGGSSSVEEQPASDGSAAVAPEIDIEPVAAKRVVIEQLRADMFSGDGQFGARAEVGLDEGGHSEHLVAVAHQPRCRPVATLELVAVHARAAADRTFGDGT